MQMTALTRLHSFYLNGNVWHNGITALTALSSLRRLALSSCTFLPACLSQLTGLEALSIGDPESCRDDSAEDAATVVQAVSLLTNLTHLALARYDVGGPGQILPSLPRLRSLWWLRFGLQPPMGGLLPAFGWLTKLQRLALPIHYLHSCLAALTGACQLQTLAVDANAPEEPDLSGLLPGVLRWAAQRPDLTELFLEISDKNLIRHFPAVMDVQRAVPSLRIERHPVAEHPLFCAVG
jgi:hypothetical protein